VTGQRTCPGRTMHRRQAWTRQVGMTGQHRSTGSSPPSPDSSPGSLTGSDYVPPSPGLPIGSRSPVGPMSVAGSLSPPPPPSPYPSQPGAIRGPFSESARLLSETQHIVVNRQPPDTATEPSGGPGNTFSEPFPAEFWDKLLKGRIKRRISGSDAVNLVQKDPRNILTLMISHNLTVRGFHRF
jgi:hypothetical protein